MQGTRIACLGAELGGGRKKPLLRDDWKKTPALHATLQRCSGRLCFLCLDVTKWPLQAAPNRRAVNGSRDAAPLLEQAHNKMLPKNRPNRGVKSLPVSCWTGRRHGGRGDLDSEGGRKKEADPNSRVSEILIGNGPCIRRTNGTADWV